MLGIAVYGAGRIAKIHGANVAEHPGAELRYVVDVYREAAERLTAQCGGKALTDGAEALRDPDVEAVIIASPTNTHVDIIKAAARSGKAIFCEKPIALDIARVDACLAEVDKTGVPMFVGFNRRFDPSFMALQSELRAGHLGKIELLSITSRDPGPPPAEYIKASGGLFRDMMIHDFDMARWLLGEEPTEVFTAASCVVDPAIGEAGDVDTAVVTLQTASGALCQISNSRRAAYGYDQRIEALCERGMVQAENPTPTTVRRWTEAGITSDKLLHFFLERYEPAYKKELNHFIEALSCKTPLRCDAVDGRQSLILADAATESWKSGAPVKIAAL